MALPAAKDGLLALGRYVAPNLMYEHSPCQAKDFLAALVIAVVVLVCRLVLDRIWLPILRRFLAKLRPAGQEKAAKSLFEHFFTAGNATLLEILAVYTMMWHNGGCKPWSVDRCLLGWPHHEPNLLQRWYFIATFGYYAYELLGTSLGVVRVLKLDTIIHHVVTMSLIFSTYQVNLLRFGTMWMGLFDISNPLLETAKGLNALDAVPQVALPKWTAFFAFATTFFAARIALVPYALLRPAFTQAPTVLPRWWAVTFIILMIYLCVLQYFWFYKILHLAKKSGTKRKVSEKDT